MGKRNAAAVVEVVAPEVNIDDIEMALDGLEMPEIGETDVIEELPELEASTVEIDEAAIEATVADIEMSEARAEVYEGVEPSEDEIVTEAPAKAAKPAKTPKAPKEKKAAAPRMTVDTLPVEAFVLTLADADGDLEANKAAVLAKRPAQKKVAEKFDNLLLSVAAGKAPSKFTMDCFRALQASGSITSKELVAALEASAMKTNAEKGYNLGTARSQAGQIMSLFPSLKIATREGQKITLNPDSTLADALASMLGA